MITLEALEKLTPAGLGVRYPKAEERESHLGKDVCRYEYRALGGNHWDGLGEDVSDEKAG